MPFAKVGVGLLATVALQCVTGEAAAFCRQRTCFDGTERICGSFEEPNDCEIVQRTCVRDAAGCISEGAPLFRSSACLSFAVARGNAKGFGLHDTEVVPIVEQAFARWTNVDCGGGQRPGLSVQSVGLVTASGAHYCDEPSLNISTWFLTKPWVRGASLLGNTLTTSGRESGEIFDADVELNADKILKEFNGQNRSEVLLAVATHEAGHFLGLAHSQNPSALMYEAYSQTNLTARSLTQDDIDGICAIFPPAPTPPECGAPGVTAAALEQSACEAAMNQAASAGGGPASDDPSAGAVAKGCAVQSAGKSQGRGFALASSVLMGCALIRRRRARTALCAPDERHAP